MLTRPKGIFAEAGFPTKLEEYLVYRLPVVITKVWDIPLYLREYESALLAEPSNPESIASKMFLLIKNQKIDTKIGGKGYQWAYETLEYKKATRIIGDFIYKIFNY